MIDEDGEGGICTVHNREYKRTRYMIMANNPVFDSFYLERQFSILIVNPPTYLSCLLMAILLLYITLLLLLPLTSSSDTDMTFTVLVVGATGATGM